MKYFHENSQTKLPENKSSKTSVDNVDNFVIGEEPNAKSKEHQAQNHH